MISDTSILTCSGQSTIFSPIHNPPSTIVPYGTYYTWSSPIINPNGAISGESIPLWPETQFQQILTNLTDSIATATYIVTPEINWWNCPGNSFNITITVKPKKDTIINISICHGQSYQVGTHNYNSTGVYTDNLQTYLGCDSIVTTNLTVNPIYNIINNDTICQGDTFRIGNSIYTQSGIYTNALQSYLGCDSIITINLTVYPNSYDTINISICNGQSYQVGSHIYNSTGTYTDTLQSYLGCDSIVTTNLTVNPAPVIPDQFDTICSGDAFTVNPVNNPPLTIVPPGITYTWSAPVISPSGSVTGGSAQLIPQSYISQVLYNITNLNATATYIVIPSVDSCAGNPFNVIITVKPKPQIANDTNAICSEDNFIENPATIITNTVPLGTTYTWSAPTLSLPGSITGGIAESVPQSVISQTLTNTTNSTTEIASYTVTPSSDGCPGNPFILHMGVNPKKKTNEDITICQGQTHSVGIHTYSVSGTYHDTLVTQLGCDSIINTNLTVRPKPVANFYYTDTCNIIYFVDSSIHLIPIINWNWYFDEPISGINNFSTLQNPIHNYSNSGSYNVMLIATDSIGCKDSIILQIVVDSIPHVFYDSIMICSGDTAYYFPISGNNNNSIPLGTTYTWSNPIISPLGSITGYSSQLTGVTHFGPQLLINTTSSLAIAVYTVTPSLGNCIGIPFTLYIRVCPKPLISDTTISICSGLLSIVYLVDNPPSSLIPYGTTYTWSSPVINPIGSITGASTPVLPETHFSQFLTNITDSIATATYIVTPISWICPGSPFTITIMVNPKYNIIKNDSICQGQSYHVGTSIYTSTGIYTDSLITSNGCDSIITTKLKVNPKKYLVLNDTICQGETFQVGSSIYTLTGTYVDTLATFQLCDSIITTHLYVLKPPLFQIVKDVLLCEGVPFYISVPYGIYNLLWNDGDTLFTKIFNQSGNYSVKAYNFCGSVTNDFTLFYKNCECYLYYPNAFTPNGDGLNEMYCPGFECDFESYQLYIYNRWGQLVFETKNPSICWDGKYLGGEVPQGVYVWVVSYQSVYDKKIKSKKGSITLIR